MDKKELIIVADYSEDTELTLAELTQILNMPDEFFYDLIEYEIVRPQGSRPEEWSFNLNQLERIKAAIRLQRDLEINLAGVAIVLDLVDEMEKLEARMELLEKHFLKW